MLSVVVPCFNEEQVVDLLAAKLTEELTQLGTEFEVILVDDGSRDRTLDKLRALNERDGRYRYVALSRNFGKESAMLAGLTEVRGRAVVIMDADLQHPPHVIAQMLPYLDKGYDQVVARRNRVGDAKVRSWVSRLYYRLVNRMIEVELEDGAGDFRLLSRTALRAVLSLGEANRFSKGLFAWVGFNTATIDYTNAARAAGESKWRTRDLVNYAIDSILSFNTRPLRLAIHLGTVVSVIAFGYAVWTVVAALVHQNDTPGYVTIICAVVGFGGLQMILLGVIGEYLGRIYLETKARPHFIVRESSDGAPVTTLLGPEHELLVERALEPEPPGDARQ